PGKPLGVLRHFRTGARQSDVGGVDAERIHVVQDVDFFLDRWIPYRRRLQSVTQRLVVEHGNGAWTGGVVVPVVYQRMRLDAQSILRGAGRFTRARCKAKREEADDKYRRGGSGREPEAARDRRAHPVVDAGVRTGTLGRGNRRDDVTTSGEHDRLVEDDIPDDNRPREPQQRRDPRARDTHESIIAPINPALRRLAFTDAC